MDFNETSTSFHPFMTGFALADIQPSKYFLLFAFLSRGSLGPFYHFQAYLIHTPSLSFQRMKIKKAKDTNSQLN